MAGAVRTRSLIEVLEDHERSIKRLKLTLARVSSGGSGFPLSGLWTFRTDLTSTPTAGRIHFDNATTASVTNVYVNELDGNGQDRGLMLGALSDGEDVYVFETADQGSIAHFTVNGTPSLSSGVWTVPVTYVEADGTTPWTQNTTVTLAAMFNAGGGTAYLPLGGGTMTGVLFAADGTAANPGVAFAGANTTGLFRYGPNSLGIAAGGVQQFRIDTGSAKLSIPLKPETDNAVDLGDASLSWRNLYAYGIYDEGGTLRWNMNGVLSPASDINMGGDQLYFNYAVETTSYLQHSTSSNYFRFVNAGNEMMRFAEGIISIYGASWGQVSNLQAGAMYVTNELANVDLYLRTDNGGGAKNRMFIDGSANTITFYNHDGTTIGGWVTNRFNVGNNGTAGAPAFDIAQTGTGMFRTTTSGGRLNLAIAGTARLLVTATPTLAPNADNNMSNGASSLRWVDVWAVDTSINSSDENHKKAIKPIDLDRAYSLVENATPISYQWKGKTPYKSAKERRTHFGYGAYATRDALKESGFDPAKIGMWVDPAISPREPGDEKGAKSLRSAEMAPVVHTVVQDLVRRVSTLENRVRELEAV